MGLLEVGTNAPNPIVTDPHWGGARLPLSARSLMFQLRATRHLLTLPPMQRPTMKTHGHLAALGALGVSAGAVALYGLFFWISTPSKTGGIDPVHAEITRVSVAVIIAALVAVHIAFARQLFAYVKENRQA
jgi:hypothetical protein